MSYAVGEALIRDECLVLLRQSQVGRVAVSIDALPAIKPVNYVVVGDSLLFRAEDASDLFRSTVGSVVAFEVDDYDNAGCFGWSVLVRGIALEMTEEAEIKCGRTLLLGSWSLGEKEDHFVIVPMTLMSGRRYVRVP